MSYVTGAITNASPANALNTIVENELVINGWVFVEEVVITTVTHRVWKNPSTNNSFGTDFFVDLYYTTAVGSLNLTVKLFEIWDSVNKKAIRYAPGVTSTPQNAAGPFQYAVNDTVGVLLSSVSMSSVCYVNSNTTGFNYFLRVTTDYFYLGVFVAGVNKAFYIGLYDSSNSIADDPFPIACILLGRGTPSYSYGSSTREPKQTIAGTYNFACNSTTTIGLGQQVDTIDIYTTKYPLDRIAIMSARGNGWRGLLKDILGGGVGVTCINGDTVTNTINGVTTPYVKCSDGTNDTYWMKTN